MVSLKSLGSLNWREEKENVFFKSMFGNEEKNKNGNLWSQARMKFELRLRLRFGHWVIGSLGLLVIWSFGHLQFGHK